MATLRKYLSVFLLLVIVYFAISFAFRPSSAAVTFDTGQVSVLSSATSVAPVNQQRTGLLITNPGTVAVYLGNSAVTTANGAYLAGGGSVSIPTRDAVYGISSGATQTVTYLETYSTAF